MIPENKTRMQFTVTKEEAALIYDTADTWGMTISQYIVALCRTDRERGTSAMMIDFVEKGMNNNGTTEDMENV